MPSFEARADGLHAVRQTSFAAAGWKERADLRRLLKEHIESPEEGWLGLAGEFGGWVDSQRPIDLLCLDREANLVVVEFKPDESGRHMELQGLREAAMVCTMTFDRAARTLAPYRNRAAPDVEATRTEIIEFLGWTSAGDQLFAEHTRAGCFPSSSASSAMQVIRGRKWPPRSPAPAGGRSRSSAAATAIGSSCCRSAGSSSAPSDGSAATGAWPAILSGTAVSPPPSFAWR